MIFYDSPNPAPNPRRVRIFAAEKGIALPTQTVSIVDREHKAPEYLAVNPRGQTPALRLDDGGVLTESVAICRYLEALHPTPPLQVLQAQGERAPDLAVHGDAIAPGVEVRYVEVDELVVRGHRRDRPVEHLQVHPVVAEREPGLGVAEGAAIGAAGGAVVGAATSDGDRRWERDRRGREYYIDRNGRRVYR